VEHDQHGQHGHDHVVVHDEHRQDDQQTVAIVVHNPRHPQVHHHKRVPRVDDHDIQQGGIVPRREVVQ
jgi:hypothetical protein